MFILVNPKIYLKIIVIEQNNKSINKLHILLIILASTILKKSKHILIIQIHILVNIDIYTINLNMSTIIKIKKDDGILL
jgi:hypothetical protein